MKPMAAMLSLAFSREEYIEPIMEAPMASQDLRLSTF